MEFRERLYQLRKGRGISQEELAHTVGVSRQAVQKWEAGAATPDLNNLSALADYFAVSLDYLVRGIEPEKPAAPSPQQAVIQNYYTGWSYAVSAAAAPSSACRWCISTCGIVGSAGPRELLPSATWPPVFWPLAVFPPACCPSAAWVSDC